MPVYFFENRRYPQWLRFLELGRELSFGHPRGVAYERDGYFFATGLNRGGETVAAPSDGRSIGEWINDVFGDSSPFESSNQPGVRFKRIARPETTSITRFNPAMRDKLNQSLVVLKILILKLEELFETIEPTPSNLSTYGHTIRDVLLLACMEVESSWTAVLKENGYNSPRGTFTTNDYVKLFSPMMLDGYELGLQAYSSYPIFAPFAL